jgi:hypothetical protein
MNFISFKIIKNIFYFKFQNLTINFILNNLLLENFYLLFYIQFFDKILF